MNDSSRRGGFTLIEVIVSVGILALLSSGLVTLYRQSMLSYRLTSWKQERTRQAELLWNRLRKPLEEASDQLDRKDLPTVGWTIVKTSRPLLFNPSPAGGKFMAWQVDHFDMATGLVEGPLTWSLTRVGRTIRMDGPNTPGLVVLEDVDTIAIKATQIRQTDGTFVEELDLSNTGTGEIIGSVLEISIILTPPPDLRDSLARLVQNAKFKLVVEGQPTSTPNY